MTHQTLYQNVIPDGHLYSILRLAYIDNPSSDDLHCLIVYGSRNLSYDIKSHVKDKTGFRSNRAILDNHENVVRDFCSLERILVS